MPPKRGRGRGRGPPRCRQEQYTPPGDPNSQRQQEYSDPAAGGVAVPSQLPRSYPRQQEYRDRAACGGGVPSQLPRSSSRGIASPPAEVAAHHEYSAPRKQTKTRTVHPEELGIELQRKAVVTSSLPLRPGTCNEGRRIKLISNCFPIKIPDGYVYHYDVEIIERGGNQQPERKDAAAGGKKSRRLNAKTNRKIISRLLETPKFASVCAVYDGNKNLYTRKELKIEFPFLCDISLIDEYSGNPDDPRGPRQNIYQVLIKPVNIKDGGSCAINLDEVHEFYAGNTSSVPLEAIMAVETVLRHRPSLTLVPMGRSFFYPPNPGSLNPLGGGLEIWFGYHQSIRLGQWKPTVNLDVVATSFYQEGPVLDFVATCMNMRVDQLRRLSFINDSDNKRINRKLKSLQIKVTHLRYPRKHKIVKVTKLSANRLTFDLDVNGRTEKITVAQYFANNYGRILEFPNLPCLHVQPVKKNIYLPIEVCELLPGQHYKGELSRIQKSKMIEFTSAPPKIRFRRIDDVVRNADFDKDKYVRGFDVEVSRRPLNVEARVLEAPSLLYNDERDSEKRIDPKEGSWNLRNTHFLQGARIPPWILLHFGGSPYHFLKKFAELLVSIGRNLGMEICPPFDIKNVSDPSCNKIRLLGEVKKKGAKLAVMVIPKLEEREEKKFYADIKKAAETEIGLTTQCIKEDTMRDISGKRGPQIVNNLCLKINAKMGGENNSLVNFIIPDVLFKPVIIIGADVNHPPPTQLDQPSIAACVGTLDSFCKRSAVSLRLQVNSDENKRKLEIICDLQDMVKELLLQFYHHTGKKKPEKIIFYRDGVSEGEFEKVQNKEIVSIRRACRSLQNDYEPGITFLVVQKRHHVRFLPQDDRDAVRKNVPPGTVVDNTVTHPRNFDFFLCSHLGLQGTSRPSYYTVIEDDNEFSATEIQKLTYQLCHMYVRCTKSISIPAPVAYADLVAYRARKHLEAQSREDSGSSSGDSSLGPRLSQEDIKAIEVVANLKSSMYFV